MVKYSPAISSRVTFNRRKPGSASLNAASTTSGSEVWNGPYVKGGRVPSDPWGHAYLYHSPVERAPYEIVSYGSDGHEGGTGSAADISNVEH